ATARPRRGRPASPVRRVRTHLAMPQSYLRLRRKASNRLFCSPACRSGGERDLELDLDRVAHLQRAAQTLVGLDAEPGLHHLQRARQRPRGGELELEARGLGATGELKVALDADRSLAALHRARPE